MHIHINEVIKGWEKKIKDCKSNFIKLSILICIKTLLSLKNAKENKTLNLKINFYVWNEKSFLKFSNFYLLLVQNNNVTMMIFIHYEILLLFI